MLMLTVDKASCSLVTCRYVYTLGAKKKKINTFLSYLLSCSRRANNQINRQMNRIKIKFLIHVHGEFTHAWNSKDSEATLGRCEIPYKREKAGNGVLDFRSENGVCLRRLWTTWGQGLCLLQFSIYSVKHDALTCRT